MSTAPLLALLLLGAPAPTVEVRPEPAFAAGILGARFGQTDADFFASTLGASLCPEPTRACARDAFGERCTCTGRFFDSPVHGEVAFARKGEATQLAQIRIERPSAGAEAWQASIVSRLLQDIEKEGRRFQLHDMEGMAYDDRRHDALLAIARVARSRDGATAIFLVRRTALALAAEGNQPPAETGRLSRHRGPRIPIPRRLPETHWVGYELEGVGSFTHHQLSSSPGPGDVPAAINDEGRIFSGLTLSAIQLTDRSAWGYEAGYLAGFLGAGPGRAKYTLIPLGIGLKLLPLTPAHRIRPFAGIHAGLAHARMRVLAAPEAEGTWLPFGAAELGVRLFAASSVGLLASVRYDYARTTHFAGAPNLDPSGLTFRVGLMLGGGENPAAEMPAEEYRSLAQNQPAKEVAALAESMSRFWKPIGRLVPDGSELSQPVERGTYRLRALEGVHLFGGPEDNAVDESTQIVFSHAGAMYVVALQPDAIRALVASDPGAHRFVEVEELDYDAWHESLTPEQKSKW